MDLTLEYLKKKIKNKKNDKRNDYFLEKCLQFIMCFFYSYAMKFI